MWRRGGKRWQERIEERKTKMQGKSRRSGQGGKERGNVGGGSEVEGKRREEKIE